jgi:predicted aspartyl protease
VTTRRSLIANLGLVALLGGGVWLARDRLLWPTPRPLFDAPVGPWLPFLGPDQPLVVVAAGVGGTMVHALIDSGAQYTSIDRRLVERFGLASGPALPMVALGVGGAAQVAKGVSLDLELGRLRFPRLRAAALDLGVVSQALGLEVPLIIGFDVLSAVAAEIDFPRRRMRFADPKGGNLPAGGVAAPVRRAGRALLAKVSIEGRPLEVLVDTGATGLVGLSADAAQQVGLVAQGARQGRSVVLGGVAVSQVVTAERFDFAGEAFRDVDIHIIQLPRVPGFPKGLLGVEALRHRRVSIDAGAGSLRLYPS